jgi:hypothetical protein
MATNSEARICRLEMLLSSINRTLAKVDQRLDNLESQIRQIPPGGGGGGAVAAFWVKGTFAAGAGSWPGITPTVQTLDVYRDVGGVPTLFAAGATVRWFYLDASGANKLIPVTPNGDGTYDAINASCTGV